MQRILTAALVCIGLSACDAPAGRDYDLPFDILEPTGKADGSSLLSAADRERLEAAFDSALTEAEATIGALEAEIASLEADHAAKKQEADELVSRIAAREEELRRQYNSNLLLCAFFPNPATCVLANYLANDSTLNQYNAQLAAARAEQQRITSEITEYNGKRDRIRAEITGIRSGKAALLEALRDNAGPTIHPALATAPSVGQAHWRSQQMAAVLSLIGQEVGKLVELRNIAAELSEVLSESIATLRALETSVEALVRASRERFMDLLADLLSGDPAAAAQAWLEEELKRKTQSMLSALAWPVSEFVAQLLNGTTSGELFDQLVTSLSATPDTVVIASTVEVSIVSLTTATSTINVPANAHTRGELFVDIEHDYVGDLRISVVHNGVERVLRNQVGGNQQTVTASYPLVLADFGESGGPWTLRVRDVFEDDEGTLVRWGLTLQ